MSSQAQEVTAVRFSPAVLMYRFRLSWTCSTSYLRPKLQQKQGQVPCGSSSLFLITTDLNPSRPHLIFPESRQVVVTPRALLLHQEAMSASRCACDSLAMGVVQAEKVSRLGFRCLGCFGLSAMTNSGVQSWSFGRRDVRFLRLL